MTYHHNIHFTIILPCYNVEPWISKTINMLQNQTHSNFDVFIIDDCSEDGTWDIVKTACVDFRFNAKRNIFRKRTLYNQVCAINESLSTNEDIIFIHDGDDWLNSVNSLHKIANAYAEFDCWVTYGNMVPFPQNNPIKEIYQIDDKFDIRKGPWIFHQPRTFKYFLWKNLEYNNSLLSKKNGKFFEAAADVAVFRPILEMAGWNKVKFIPDPLYVWNRANPMAEAKIDKKLQSDSYIEIDNQKPYDKKEKKDLL